ncbi:MAG: CvpA family protein [Mizugakiibacter sp.]|uniref:CvpA family protein n=1 Tax=Mizugakiibacter sp. TaxID=1972610 RepID=UPI0031BD9982|nr:CvpA family protein [Xanthomonadaceae bacterium]
MNFADYIILGVLALSVLFGLWRGLIGEVLALAIWAAAAAVAWLFGPRLAQMFAAHVEVPSVRLLLGYGLCFIVVLLAGALLGFLVRKLVEGSGLSGSDRLFGMLFGLARGLVLVTLAVLLLGFTPFPRDPWWRQSRLLPSFEQAAAWLSVRLPADVNKYLQYGARGLPAPHRPPSQLQAPQGPAAAQQT